MNPGLNTGLKLDRGLSLRLQQMNEPLFEYFLPTPVCCPLPNGLTVLVLTTDNTSIKSKEGSILTLVTSS